MNYTTKVVKRCQVRLPTGSVPTTNIPLSFFDLLWTICPPIRRFFFFHFPHSTHHFINTIFPNLQQSLALSLQHFFPLAGNLIFPPPQPHNNRNPQLLYTTDDSVPLLVVEASGFDFDHLIADYPKEAKQFYPLVPDFPNSRVFPDGTRALPLLAIQITIFPNRGLCFCVAFHHAVADGMAVLHFIKSWASIYATGSFSGLLPCHDRAMMKHPNETLDLESVFSRELSGWDFKDMDKAKPIIELAPVNKVRATFVISKTQIEKFKTWVSSSELEALRVSAFIVTTSLIWSCLIKSTENEEKKEDCFSDEMCYLVFVADCRNRLNYPIPQTYFGNCLDVCVVGLQKNEILKDNNIVAVVKAIGNRVKEFEKEPLKMAEEWFSEWRRCEESGRILTIAGSPKLRAYDLEFGWGKPQKIEVLHVDTSNAISLHESRDKEGGIEIGVGLSNIIHMNRFIANWEQYLNLLCT